MPGEDTTKLSLWVFNSPIALNKEVHSESYKKSMYSFYDISVYMSRMNNLFLKHLPVSKLN